MCAANWLSRRHQVPNWKGTRFSSVGEPEWRNEESTYRRGCGETIETRIGHSRDTEKMDIKFQFHCLGNCTNTFCFTKLHHLITVEAISYWKHSMSYLPTGNWNWSYWRTRWCTHLKTNTPQELSCCSKLPYTNTQSYALFFVTTDIGPHQCCKNVESDDLKRIGRPPI